MFGDFHFLRPEWLLALPLLAALAWFWYRRNSRQSGWEAAIDNNLLEFLIEPGGSQSKRWLPWALGMAISLSIAAVAGPTWQKLPQDVEQKQDTLIILLDLSLSMLATDVKPSRLDRARQEIADILRLRDEGETALIAYAGDAHAVVPLTDDVATIDNLLFSLSPEMMPVFGSNPNHALELANELFANGNHLQGRILMVTDGIDDISSVSRHRSAAFPISILGVGTERGSTIPLDKLRQPGRVLLTQEGDQILAQLDEGRLREVAGLTFGEYRRSSVGDEDVLAALDTPLPSEDETIDVEREFDTWFDQGHWLAILLLPLLLFAFRKGIVVCAVFVFLPAAEVRAESEITEGFKNLWSSLWQRSDQRGAQLMRHGRPEAAAAIFEDPQWRSAAQYRSGEYTAAAAGFNQDESITGRYNLGNALARNGDYAGAIERYEEVLAADPSHEDALFNKELIERLQQEQQEAQEQQNQDQESQANNEQSDSEQDQQEQEQDTSEQEQQAENSEQQQNQEQEQQSEQQQNGEQQEPQEREEEQANRDEQQEALEQWLRRVPDDPGGLLRRKFSHETKQRLRRGEYENRQGDKLW